MLIEFYLKNYLLPSSRKNGRVKPDKKYLGLYAFFQRGSYLNMYLFYTQTL